MTESAHAVRMQKAARSLLGQKGCEHHDQAPTVHGDAWYCPACEASVPGDAVEAFAYPPGEPKEVA